jgi:hypothetical protein
MQACEEAVVCIHFFFYSFHLKQKERENGTPHSKCMNCYGRLPLSYTVECPVWAVIYMSRNTSCRSIITSQAPTDVTYWSVIPPFRIHFWNSDSYRHLIGPLLRWSANHKDSTCTEYSTEGTQTHIRMVRLGLELTISIIKPSNTVHPHWQRCHYVRLIIITIIIIIIIKKDEMGGAYSTNGGEEECI